MNLGEAEDQRFHLFETAAGGRVWKRPKRALEFIKNVSGKRKRDLGNNPSNHDSLFFIEISGNLQFLI
jgi:hypothetical protein